MNQSNLRRLAYQCLIDLSTKEGINASSRNENFGCIFGRDSAITALKILRTYTKKPSLPLLKISRNSLLSLVCLQGRKINIESGEESGKFIHEYRKNRFEHLASGLKPWFIYPEGVLKNYDSIDSTPLTLIAIYRYWQVTGDNAFLVTTLPAVEAGLNWIISFGDIDKDGLLEYDFPSQRQSGGLLIQSWTDSHESLRQASGQLPKFPIAPIEVQAYAWLALKLWSDYFKIDSAKFAKKLLSQAKLIRKKVNQLFILKDEGLFFGAQALDGDKNQIRTITANPLLTLWASYSGFGKRQCLIQRRFIKDFVKRAFLPDMYSEEAGVRTMSTKSATFNPNQDSYHNGSFWPILNGMIIEGLENFGFLLSAYRLKQAAIKPLNYFKCPIELYITKEDGSYLEYCSPSGQVSCKNQAWSAAAALDFLT